MGIFVRTKSFLNYVCFIFLFLNKLSMSLIIRWIKKNLFDYYLSYCKFISDRKKPVELYEDGQNRDGKY